MAEAEVSARAAGKTLLVLDTANDAANRLYLRRGWQRVGVIPGYALWPTGGAVDTTVYYKELTSSPPDRPGQGAGRTRATYAFGNRSTPGGVP